MDVKKRITITGQKVHDIGYCPFLLGIAESFEIERFFADNTFIDQKQVVYALIESSEEKAEAFVGVASSKFPEKSDVEKVNVEDYSGNVMKIESYYRYLTAMQLSKIAAYGGRMLDKQDKMLDKQDTTIQILRTVSEEIGSVHEELRSIHEDTSDMKSTLSRIEVDVKDTKFSLSSFIEEKFRKQEEEIAEIKATLAGMQAAG